MNLKKKHVQEPFEVSGVTVYAMGKDGFDRPCPKFKCKVETPSRVFENLDQLHATAKLFSASDELMTAIWELMMTRNYPQGSPLKDAALQKARNAAKKAGYPLPAGW